MSAHVHCTTVKAYAGHNVPDNGQSRPAAVGHLTIWLRKACVPDSKWPFHCALLTRDLENGIKGMKGNGLEGELWWKCGQIYYFLSHCALGLSEWNVEFTVNGLCMDHGWISTRDLCFSYVIYLQRTTEIQREASPLPKKWLRWCKAVTFAPFLRRQTEPRRAVE